jgi:type IV pilus assembly protein PilY1
MTNLDQFRRIMTGGKRILDTTTQTVLQRGFTDTQMGTGGGNYFPDKTAKTADAGPLGSSSTTYAYKNASLGDKMLVQSGNSVTITNLTALQMATQSCAALKTSYKSANNNNNPPWTCYDIRVQVCTSATSLESNCTQYGSNYKPEGLMQKYNSNMRFSAFGYLLDNTKARQGGVLRARMKSVGPTIANAISLTTNAATEWDSTTGVFVTNPDTADASATGVSNSGVINYLNDFGYNGGNNNGIAYKGYDPVSELYYEALRYLRGMPNSGTPIASMNSTMYDSFPVIKFDGGVNIPDPVISACQKNFIITLGDVNTWCDVRLPGGYATNPWSGSGCGTGTLPTDTGGAVTTAVNFSTPTNAVSSLESSTAFTSSTAVSTGRGDGFFIDGLAYWAHVNDIRPDKASSRPAGTIQNVTSFFIDVLEPYNGVSQTGTTKTEYWLAAKYGGFDLSLTDQTSTSTKSNPNSKLAGSTKVAWDTNGDGVPDNWFAGNDPVAMSAGLSAAFDKIASAGTTGNGGAAGASGVSLATANKIYYAGYTMENSGRGWLYSCPYGVSAADCATSLDWDASQWLSSNPVPSAQYTSQVDTAAHIAARQIITRANGAGVEFLYANLASGDKTNLAYNPSTQFADSATLAAERVDYLRGGSGNEIVNGGPFRTRSGTKLGDIVGSGPVYVGAPNALYNGALFPGYSDFITNNATRTPVVYVGANDGMLHAFSAADGHELLAYVPEYFLQPDNGNNASRIAALTDPTYKHKFFVDATPMVGDVMDGTTWRSILLGAYGAGGKGFFALDVTNPANLTATNASTISLWEKSGSDNTGINDTDIGYTFNQPVFSPISGQSLQFALIPTATGSAWAIIVGNGFGSSAGKAALYFLNPITGATLTKVITESSSGANGLATPFPVDTDGDGMIDTIWAGDLQGTMWRIRWDNTVSTSPTYHTWVSTALYQGGATKPITSAPFVAPHCSIAGAKNVVFGTGEYIQSGDYNTTTQQSLYGIIDTLSGSTVALSSLQQQTVTTSAPDANGLITRSYSNNPINFTSQKGWYINLPDTGERSISNPTIAADTGIAVLGSFVPPSACMPITGYGNIVNACTGGAAYDPVTGLVITGIGAQGLGIPYISNPVSDATSVKITIGNGGATVTPAGGTPVFPPLTINKGFTRGVRATWQELR